MSPRLLAIPAAIGLAVLTTACPSDKTGEPPAQAAVDKPSPSPPAAPAPPLPADRPRFSWHPPLSVPIEETGTVKGRLVRSRYWLDACPSKDGTIVLTRRDLQLLSINNAPPSPKLAEKVDGGAEGAPDMTIDRAGAFVNTDPTTDWRMADLWHGWVELWLHVDPSGGNPQEIAVKSIGNGARTVISYQGWGRERRARWEARRNMSGDEVWQLTKDKMLKGGLQDYEVAKLTRSAQETLEVETEWPELRPWFAHSRKTVLFAKGGEDREFVEDREYRFDWGAADSQKPKCP